jgi:GNAT superfamily N-acetyltransferase
MKSTGRLLAMPHDLKTLRQVAELHATCIDQGFLSTLGPSFLTVLYGAIDRSSTSVLLVETKSASVTGFVSGGFGMAPIYRQMLRDWPKLIASLAHVILSPRKILGIIEILRQRGVRDIDFELPRAELFSIVVAPDARGSDTAKRLFGSLCTHFEEQGIPAFRIVVGNSLIPAKQFYCHMGAEPATSLRVHGKATSTVYVQHLKERADAPPTTEIRS